MAKTSETVTVQYEQVISRRGQLTTAIKEKTFRSRKALAAWEERENNFGAGVTILRYLSSTDQDRENS